MAKQARQNDCFADARKYAGKNTAQRVDTKGPYVVHPGGRTFHEQWCGDSHRAPTGKQK